MPTGNCVSLGIIEHHCAQHTIVNHSPTALWFGQLKYPPDNQFHSEEEKIVDEAKYHQPPNVKAKANGRERHEYGIESRLAQLLLPSVVTCAVKWIKVDERCDLVICQQQQLAAEDCDQHKSSSFVKGSPGDHRFLLRIVADSDGCAKSRFYDGCATAEVFCPIHSRLPSGSSTRNSVMP